MIRNAIGNCIRNSSCSSGWLRLLVQCIFAAITVTSFVLIVIMAVKNPSSGPNKREPVKTRCELTSCKVLCRDAPYYEKYEEDIYLSVMEAQNNCRRIYLELYNPHFTNNTLPCNWLSALENDVSQLTIIGGNLMHVPSGAFMTQFGAALNSLQLKDLRIQTLEPNSFVGLSKIRKLTITVSWIDGVRQNVLQAIDDTLETLTVTKSGDFDPVVFTGFRSLYKLTIVDLSFNNFHQVLNRNSFIGLEVTKILYLNSCRITFIGPGTFDYLTSIEVLYLNDNKLTSLSTGLFDVIAGLNDPRPRIHLQDNYWHCHCKSEMRQLVEKKILLVDPECTTPEEMKSITFSEFYFNCRINNDSYKIEYTNDSNNIYNLDKYYPEPVFINGSTCNAVRSTTDTIRLISTLPNNICSSKKFQYLDLVSLVNQSAESLPYNNWLTHSFFLSTNGYSVAQLGAVHEQDKYGLLWYQPDCPQAVFCLDVIPKYLKLYNRDMNAAYRFCPIYIRNASVNMDDCVEISAKRNGLYYEIDPSIRISTIRIVIYFIIMLISSCLGAIAVYALIRNKPTLLKGSKRIVFVKHKDIDALVLPPKIPLRDEQNECKDKEVFTLTPGINDRLKLPNLHRMKSVRSNKSGSPSYITALQPTEDQLAEWRIRHHFNNDLTISSRKSELSTLSLRDTNYYSLDGSDATYESLK